MKNLISNSTSVIHPEVYKLSLASSPHIAARKDNVKIDLDVIIEKYRQLASGNTAQSGATGNQQLAIPSEAGQPATENYKLETTNYKLIEGAGGLLVPLNENEFVIDLIQKLNAKVILVSRNYLGSINHSLLTAAVCKKRKLKVIGWIFNDQFMHYEDEIVQWSGYKKIASIPYTKEINSSFIKQQADKYKNAFTRFLK